MKILFSILCLLASISAIPLLITLLIIGLPVLIKGRKSYMNYILVSIATSLGSLLIPLAFIYSFITVKKEAFPKYLMNIAISIDQSGGVYLAPLFNKVFIKDGSNQYGNPDETISSVTGRNKLSDNLTNTGKAFDLLLDVFEKNHSINSIEKL